MRTRPPLTPVALLAGAALALGCSGVSAGQSGALRRTIEATPVVLDATLVALAGAIRENEIGRVLDDPTRTTLSDGDFAVLLDSEARAVLLANLGVLTRYAEALQTLADRSYRGQFADAVSRFNAQLNRTLQTIDNARGEPNLSDAELTRIRSDSEQLAGIFAAVGEAALDFYAQRRALKIVRSNQVAVRDLCSSLQRLVHPDPDLTVDTSTAQAAPSEVFGDHGLTRLARLNFAAVRDGISIDYHELMQREPRTGSASTHAKWEKQRAELVEGYYDELQREQQILSQLSAARRSIGAFADANDALASGDEMNFWSAIAQATDLLELTARSLEAPRS